MNTQKNSNNKLSHQTECCHSKLSFKEIYSQSLGMVIGAGIITSTGFCIGYTGTGVWLAYILAGLTVLIAYLPSIIGGSVVPKTSGNYFMVCQMHPTLGGFYSLMLLFSCISIGFMGTSFASYMNTLIPYGNTRFWGLLILTVFFLANLLDQKKVVKIQTFHNIILVLAWLSFIVSGAGKVNFDIVFSLNEMFPHGFKGMYEAVTMLVFAMGGGLWLIDSGERIEHPERNILLGNIASTGTAMLLFAVIAVIASGILPIAEVANQPLTKVARTIYPGNGYLFFIIGGALMALCTTINARFMGAANGLVRCSMEGWFPSSMAKKNNNDVPYLFLIIVYLITIIPVLFDIDSVLLNRLSVTVTLISMLMPNISFIFLIRKHQTEWKSSRWYLPKSPTLGLYILSNFIMIALIAKNLASLTPSLIVSVSIILIVFAIYSIFRTPFAKKVMNKTT